MVSLDDSSTKGSRSPAFENFYCEELDRPPFNFI